jgi:2-polyprenyl-6-methoxyphenol hydroxylase-like FAD-dependent oxidoreductase
LKGPGGTPGLNFFDHKLNRLLSIDLPQTDQSAPDGARPISRIALRQILLEGLEDVVVFGKTFAAFESSPKGRVIVRYEHEMIDYGFAAVRTSLVQMDRLHARSPLKRFATKALFRLVDRSPMLQKRMVGLSS